MSNPRNRICFIISTLIVILFVALVLYFIKLSTLHYKVDYFNDTMKVNAMSVYNNNYYYVDNNKKIYKLSSDNENECLIEGTDISGISVLSNFIYYISHERLFRYNIETEFTELLDEEYGYQYLSSDNKYIYVLRFIDGNYTNYRLIKINDTERYEFISEDGDADKSITVFNQDNDYKYLCNNTPYKSFCGIVDKNNNIIFRGNDRTNRNLLYFNDVIITSNEDRNQLLTYDKAGNLMDTTNLPANYSYNPQNIFTDDTNIYMLLQSQNGYNAIGYYNLPQSRHKTDALVKYDVKNGIFDFIYTTSNKYERIIGYKDDFIICLRNKDLYRIDSNTLQKEKLAKINVSDAMFELCGSKLFVWNNNKYYGAYDIN